MKELFIALSFMLLVSPTSAQSRLDPVIDYIKAKKAFVPLLDTANYPVSIKPYYKPILSRFLNDATNFYISTKGIEETSDLLSILVYHYRGFEREKRFEDEDREANKDKKAGEPIQQSGLTGNASGKDGTLVIDKKTKEVIRFLLWQ